RDGRRRRHARRLARAGHRGAGPRVPLGSGGAPPDAAARPPRVGWAGGHARGGPLRPRLVGRRRDEPHRRPPQVDGDDRLLRPQGVPAGRRRGVAVRMSQPAPLDEFDPQEFPPTLREVMLRPRWIGMLLLCLVVAGIFATLLQWQLSRALATDPVPEGATEEVRPIADVVDPGDYLAGPLVGQRVEVSGPWDPDDFLIVSQRPNDGGGGSWLTGRVAQ